MNLTQNQTEEICTATFLFLAQNQRGERKEGREIVMIAIIESKS